MSHSISSPSFCLLKFLSSKRKRLLFPHPKRRWAFCACAIWRVLMVVSAGVRRRGVPSSRKCKIKHGCPLWKRFCAVPWNNCAVSREVYVTCGKKKQKTKQNRSVAFEMLELAMTWKLFRLEFFPRVTCQLQMFAKVAEGLFTDINGQDRHSTTSTTSALTPIC